MAMEAVMECKSKQLRLPKPSEGRRRRIVKLAGEV
jgi:hypothetical protein